MAPPLGLTWIDTFGLALFIVSTLVYHIGYVVYARGHPLRTVKGKIHLYRRTWVKRVVESDEPILGVQSNRNLVMTASFMASSALLVIAVTVNLLVQFNPERLGFVDPEHVRVKLGLLLTVLGFAFVAFLQCLRDLNHFTVLVGADQDLIGHVEPVDALTYLSNLINRSADRYTYGQRAFLFALPVVAWLFSARAFIIATLLLIVYVAGFLDFQKWRPPAVFRKEAEHLKRPPFP